MTTNFNVGDLLTGNNSYGGDSLFIVMFSNGIVYKLIICETGDKSVSYHMFSKDTCEECLKKI